MATRPQKHRFIQTALAFFPLAAISAAIRLDLNLEFSEWPAENGAFALIVLLYAAFLTVALLQTQAAGVALMVASSLVLAGVGLAWEGFTMLAVALFAAAITCCNKAPPVHDDIKSVLEGISGAMALAVGGLALIIAVFARFEMQPVLFLIGSLAFIFGGYGLMRRDTYGYPVLALGGLFALMLLSPLPNEPMCVPIALMVCCCIARWRTLAHEVQKSTLDPRPWTLTPQTAMEVEYLCPPLCPVVRPGRTPRSIPDQAVQVRQGLRSFPSNTIRR